MPGATTLLLFPWAVTLLGLAACAMSARSALGVGRYRSRIVGAAVFAAANLAVSVAGLFFGAWSMLVFTLANFAAVAIGFYRDRPPTSGRTGN